MDTNPCDVCGAEFLVGGSGGGATRYPRTTVGSGDPTSAMLAEASAGDMYYDVKTGVGWLCQSAGDTGKQWTKVVGFAGADIDLSGYVKFTDLTGEEYNFVTYKEVTEDILGDAPVNKEPVLKKYALAADVTKDIEAAKDAAHQDAIDTVTDNMSAYYTATQTEAAFLRKETSGDNKGAKDLYLAIADFNAVTYKAAIASENVVRDAYFVLTAKKNTGGVFLDAELGPYMKTADFDNKVKKYVTDNELCTKTYVDNYSYPRGTLDSKLNEKLSIADKTYVDLKTSVAANTEAISKINQADLSPYLKSADAANTYLKREDYVAGVTMAEVKALGYAEVSKALDDTTESDSKAPSVNAVKSYVGSKLTSVDVGAAVDAALEAKLSDFAVQAGSAAKLVALSGDGPYALANFAISSVTVGASATGASFTLPAATSGVARNFALVIEIPSGWTGSSFALTLTPASGETVSYFGGFSASFDMSGVAAGETVMYSFAEIMAGKFRVARCLLDAVTVS